MDNTSPKTFVFILMPFSDEFDDVYQLGIKPACEKAGAYAERVDEQIFNETILQRIYNQIAKADVVIAEMTGRNPNVFYETGYAHALGKNVILLTQKAEDIPFDLKHFPHIVYGNKINKLIPQLEKKVRWFIENPKATFPPPEPPIDFYIDGVSLLSDPTIQCPIQNKDTDTIDLQIDAHNSPDKTIRTIAFKIAFQTTNRLAINLQNSIPSKFTPWVKSPDGGFIHLPDIEYNIIPGAWESIFVKVYSLGGAFRNNEVEDITLSLFSEMGVMNYPFKIKIASVRKKNITSASTGRRKTRRP
jgi:hypothetical protein